MMQYENEYEQISQDNEENLGKDTSSRKTQICLYSDPTHFIFELLQNADDYGATEVRFSLYADRLNVEHNGQPFTWDNVRSITYIGKSTSKDDPIKEGRFGLGFKSVFAFTATPRVYSDDKCFEIFGLYRVRGLEPPPDLRPRFTRFALPFNHRDQKPDYIENLVEPDEAFERIAAKLEKLYMMTLLFTQNVKTISWEISGAHDLLRGDYQRQDEMLHKDPAFSVRRTVLEDHKTRVPLMVFGRPIIWTGDEHKPVEVAFALDQKEGIIESHEHLFVLFPTEVDTHLAFMVNGPYQTNPARETLFRDRPYNKFLVQETAGLLREALPYIKLESLLATGLLGVLPLDDDGVPDFLEPLSSTIRDAFISQPLVPTNAGGFAPAKTLLQGPKAIRDVITDPLFPAFSQSQNHWAAGVMQNSRAEKFLRSLGIPSWSWTELDAAVDRLFASGDEANWLGDQKDEWVRRFYQLLYQLVHNEDLGQNVEQWRVVRTTSDQHVRGREAHFPDFDSHRARRSFHLVKPSVLKAKALDKRQRTNIRDFLQKAGVKDLTEREQIVRILDSYYRTDSKGKSLTSQTHLQHTRRFVKYARENGTPIFQDHVLFWEKEGGALRKPDEFYLDKPFGKTGLGVWYAATGGKTPLKLPLWDGYVQIEGFPEFAYEIGAVNCLRVEQVSTRRNPSYEELHVEGYVTKMGRAGRWVVDEDYTIAGADCVLKKKNPALSRLVWNAMCQADSGCLTARYALSTRRGQPRQADSQIVHILRSMRWIPDKAGRFWKPENMVAERLATGFHFDDDNGWLTAIGFGKAAGKRSEEGRKQQEVADQLGITLSMMKLVELLKRVPDDQRDPLIEECARLAREARTRGTEFPDRVASNSERRKSKILEQLAEAPAKQYEQKKRTVRTSLAWIFARGDPTAMR